MQVNLILARKKSNAEKEGNARLHDFKNSD